MNYYNFPSLQPENKTTHATNYLVNILNQYNSDYNNKQTLHYYK